MTFTLSAAGGDGEALEKGDARETKDGGRDILDTIPQELEIEVLSSGNKVAISVGGTPVSSTTILHKLEEICLFGARRMLTL